MNDMDLIRSESPILYGWI